MLSLKSSGLVLPLPSTLWLVSADDGGFIHINAYVREAFHCWEVTLGPLGPCDLWSAPVEQWS